MFCDTPKNLKNIQKRDTGQYFGANNPWITDVPDGHPCLPGIPDDEVNLLLMILDGAMVPAAQDSNDNDDSRASSSRMGITNTTQLSFQVGI